MNEFTKEELGIIYCNLCINPKTKDILLKIQSMFDNYCEHPRMMPTEILNIPLHCLDCGEKFE